MVTRKLKQKTELPDSESAIRFLIRSTVLPFWVFSGWHLAHSDRNGPVGLVNVVNGSVGTVTSRHHTGHRGGPASVTSHNRRYIVLCIFVIPVSMYVRCTEREAVVHQCRVYHVAPLCTAE